MTHLTEDAEERLALAWNDTITHLAGVDDNHLWRDQPDTVRDSLRALVGKVLTWTKPSPDELEDLIGAVWVKIGVAHLSGLSPEHSWQHQADQAKTALIGLMSAVLDQLESPAEADTPTADLWEPIEFDDIVGGDYVEMTVPQTNGSEPSTFRGLADEAVTPSNGTALAWLDSEGFLVARLLDTATYARRLTPQDAPDPHEDRLIEVSAHFTADGSLNTADTFPAMGHRGKYICGDDWLESHDIVRWKPL